MMKLFINVAFPYPSGGMHVGHGRTYLVPDVIARFYRMRGYDVLYPMGFHCTGTPVVGISQRIKRGDKDAIRIYRDLYRVPEHVFREFTNPEKIVEHFSNEYRDNMNALLLSIDWSRCFRSIDPHFKKFVEWQYRKLMDMGLISKGKHPVKWCPNDGNPVGDHDLLVGEGAKISKVTLLKFRTEDAILPAATLRPETIFGCTNVWVNPDVRYVIAEVDGERWVISRECSEKLEMQLRNVRVVGEIKGSELVGRSVKCPLIQREVPLLPATFVDPKIGTGIVFSVPAHAPYDYMGLADLKRNPGEFRNLVKDLEPISIIKVEGYGEFPAKDVCERMRISDQKDPKLEEATKLVYHDELVRGVMKENTDYAGMRVSLARDVVRDEMIMRNDADEMYEFSESPVICRCGSECTIKVIEDQWFLRYSDAEWKKKTKEALSRVKLVPEEVRPQFEHTIDWLEDWACTRKVGLGTKFPWDRSQIIEPLSDSVIYMAFYTISHILKNVDVEMIDDALFDYVFLGRDSGKLKVDRKIAEEMRKEFEYWYPYDWRFSAKDLVGNHLTFQLFHHVAIFPDKIPRGIVVFGMGLLEGNKMSSSKGNVVLLGDAISKYGADTVRLFLLSSAEPWQDFDWREKVVEGTKDMLDSVRKDIEEIVALKGDGELESIDRWMLSRMQRRIKSTIEHLERFETRRAVLESLYGVYSDLKWYRRRTNVDRGGARKVLRMVGEEWIKMLSPFIPQTCEEIWRKMGREKIEGERYPEPDESMMDEKVECAEEFLMKVHEDVSEILKVTKISPSKITFIIAQEWKRRFMHILCEDEDRVAERVKSELKDHVVECMKELRKFREHMHAVGKDKIRKFLELGVDEMRVLSEASGFFRREFGCEIYVCTPDDAPEEAKKKAEYALPMKPAIYIS